MDVPTEEEEQPLLTPEEVAANLAARNSVADRVEMDVGENLNDNWNTAEVPERREVVIVTNEEDESEKVPLSEETAEARAVAVRTYRRRPAREETSERRSEDERQRRGLGQSTGGYVESPARSTARVPFRKRRLILDEETDEEEEAFFTPIEELPSRKQPEGN